MSIAQIGLPNNPQQLIQLAQQGNVAALGKLAQLQKQAQMMKAVQSNQAMQAQEPPTVMQQTAQQVEGAGGIASPVAMARGGRVRSFQSGGVNAPEMFSVLPSGSWRGSQPVPPVSDDNDTSPAERGLAWLIERMGALKEGAKHAWNQKNGEPRADTRESPAQPNRHDIRYDAPDNPRSAPSEPALVNGVVEDNAQWLGNRLPAGELQAWARSRDPNNHRMLKAYLRAYPDDESKLSETSSAPSGLAAAAPGATAVAQPPATPSAPMMGPPAPEPDEPDAGGLAAVAPGARAAMREKANEAQRNAAYARNAYQSEMLNRLKPQQEAWYQTLGRIGGHLAKGNGQMNQSALQTLAGAAPGLIADTDMRAKATRDWENQAAQLGIDTSDRYAKQAMSELEGAYKDDAQDRADKKTALEERKVNISEKDRDTKNKLAEKRIVLQEQTRAAITRIQLAKAEASAKGQQLKPDMVFKMAQQAYAKAKEMGLSDTDAEEASNRIRMEAYVTNNELARSSASGTIPSAAAGTSGPVSPPKWK